MGKVSIENHKDIILFSIKVLSTPQVKKNTMVKWSQQRTASDACDFNWNRLEYFKFRAALDPGVIMALFSGHLISP